MRRQAPAPPSGHSPTPNTLQQVNNNNTKQSPDVVQKKEEKTSSKLQIASTTSDVCVPDTIGSELVEKVRSSTGLSYKASIDVVHTVVSHLKQNVRGLETHLDKVLHTLYPEVCCSILKFTCLSYMFWLVLFK